MTTTFTPLLGEPNALSGFASTYEGVAEAILAVAARLRAVASESASRSLAIDATKDRAAELATDISHVHPRYRETALALKEYAVRLEDAQERADAAIHDASRERNLPNLRYLRQNLEADYLSSALLPWEADKRDGIERELRQVVSQIDRAEHELRRAHGEYDQAVADRDHAARAAIHRIAPVLHHLNDRPVDYIKAAVEAVADFVALVAEWVADVMVAIVAALTEIVRALVELVVIIVAVLVLIALAIVLLAVALVVLATVIALVLAALPAIMAALQLALAREALTPTPEMKNITPPSGYRSSRNGRGAYEDLLLRNGNLDEEGGSDSTVIEVTEVLDQNGKRVGWRVTLPSTQDWELANGLPAGEAWDPAWDRGAMNDLGSNAVLMAAPQVQGAYERAVRQAMLDAGIGPDDPVMLVGWSQGGILAGKIAADRGDNFNIQAIFVAGAPIDHMDIGSDVDVISIQHDGDIVHKADLSAGRNSSNWVTVAGPPQPDRAVHEAGSYGQTAAIQIDGAGASERVAAIRDRQSQFFSENEVINRYQGHE